MEFSKSFQTFDANLVDASSIFGASEAICKRFGRSKITLDYVKLREILDQQRNLAGWKKAKLCSILLTHDPNSEGQQRFQLMLKHSGFETDLVHYRDAFVSLPPGQSPSESDAKSLTSLAPRIAYILGLMARYSSPQILVVSHCFELCGPLLDLAQRVPTGKVGIAYFSSLLDFRWKLAGLMDERLPIKFFDLDKFGADLIDVDMVPRPITIGETRSGLSRF